MNTSERRAHWDDVYRSKGETEVSWFQPEATISLALALRCEAALDAKLIDVGGGASRFVDGLLDRGFSDLTVLDLSAAALEKGRARLGVRAQRVTFVEGDVTSFEPPAPYALWHDRAVFHFLTAAADRAAYARVLARAVVPGGHAIVGTFAKDGPARCSGLDVVRYDAPSLAAALGPAFDLVDATRDEHATPGGKIHAFTFVRVKRRENDDGE